ncbi:FAD/NAD(P)-binding domain-containing protein [Wilcoxina mikolae CBS 423.85]|nr:FAD/NAD(P)-binding domain-containing protein [Wilcoxina mikolae CBS 423.85]
MASTNHNHDLFGAPDHVRHNFHCRVGNPPQKSVPPEQPVAVHGFPVPGEQSPKAATVMNDDFFLSDAKWANLKNLDMCDYVVIGSGCTALAFIEEALRLDPCKKILCLERGDFWLPSHFQNLPLPFKMVLGGESETFPFTLSAETYNNPELGYCHGSCPFFGGRSTFWSAWCPQPTPPLMRDFPPGMIATTEEPGFWEQAKGLLNVTSAADIEDTVFGDLQKMIDQKLDQSEISQLVPTADFSQPAQMAVGRSNPTSTLRFNKFSTPGPLLARNNTQRELAKEGKGAQLLIRLNATVAKLKDCSDGYVRGIQTNDRILEWNNKKTKVVLCAGAFPNATLLLNSIPSARRTVGKRVTGHFLTHIAARVPISVFGKWNQKPDLEIAAHYVAGTHPETGRQYHVQITAIHSTNPDEQADDAARECPDYAAAATRDQLVGSEEYVVFVCATLGEFTEENPNNFLRLNHNNPDPTTNVLLQYTLVDADKKLWDVMDQATYKTIEAMSGDPGALEYWDENLHGWTKKHPAVENIRVPGIVHEASTSFVGDQAHGGSLDGLYRPHGVKNLFVTGAGILPTAGSWNPTMTICGYAQDLARRLHRGEGN